MPFRDWLWNGVENCCCSHKVDKNRNSVVNTLSWLLQRLNNTHTIYNMHTAFTGSHLYIHKNSTKTFWWVVLFWFQTSCSYIESSPEQQDYSQQHIHTFCGLCCHGNSAKAGRTHPYTHWNEQKCWFIPYLIFLYDVYLTFLFHWLCWNQRSVQVF